MSATAGQRSFIEDLIDKLGYRNAKTREEYLDLILEHATTRGKASDVIDWLLEQLALRRNVRPADAGGETIAATDLAKFAFCPANYAIEKTFRVPPSAEMMAGEVKHDERKLESFLAGVQKKREREFSTGTEDSRFGDEESYVHRGDYGELLRSETIHRGHGHSNEGPFYDATGEIVGNPDYIFRRPEGDHIIVEEKHTQRSEVKRPWLNHIVQLMAYERCLRDIGIYSTYIVYFRHVYESRSRYPKHPLLFEVELSDRNRSLFDRTLKRVQTLRNTSTVSFSADKIRPRKCLSCSVNPYCNHKRGDVDELKLPYRMMRTAQSPKNSR